MIFESGCAFQFELIEAMVNTLICVTKYLVDVIIKLDQMYLNIFVILISQAILI